MGTVIINDSAKKVARDLRTILAGSSLLLNAGGGGTTKTWVNRDELQELAERLEHVSQEVDECPIREHLITIDRRPDEEEKFIYAAYLGQIKDRRGVGWSWCKPTMVGELVMCYAKEFGIQIVHEEKRR